MELLRFHRYVATTRPAGPRPWTPRTRLAQDFPRERRPLVSRHSGLGAVGPTRLARHRPSVSDRYSTIALTSASDAVAPRATIFCTTAFHSFASIRWLVTTSTE